MKQVEIIAKGPSRRATSEFYDHWWLSVAYPAGMELPRDDKIFSLHGDALLEAWLPDTLQTVVMPGTTKLKYAERINREKYLEKYGRVFACSVAWMIACAMESGYERILLNGVDHIRPEERRERESLAYLVGVANGNGVRVGFNRNAGFNLEFGAYPG